MADKLLNIINVTQIFGGLVALSEINLFVEKGEIVGIIGPNGAGKSTLFNVITGAYDPTRGKIELDGINITGYKPFRVTELGFARTFQNIRLFSRMTVLENVMMGMHCRRKTNLADILLQTPKKRKEEKESYNKAIEILKLLGLYEVRFSMPGSLPYGEQRKLEIARALATEPKLLLLDEPAAGMNEQETEELLEIVKKLKAFGYTILLIEHDMKFVMNICERIYVLNHGELIADGNPEEIRKTKSVIEAYLGKEDE
jgi:branched-chain amino acid transport system ATP-binding protein